MSDSRLRNGIGTVPDLPSRLIQTEEHDWTLLIDRVREILKAINGRLRFGSGDSGTLSGNLDGQWQTYTFTAANTAYSLRHRLGRRPVGILTLYVDANGAVVRGVDIESWTDTALQVSCSVAGTTARFIVV